MINFKDYLTEAKKKKKAKSRKDRFSWKEGDYTVTKAKELKEDVQHDKFEDSADESDHLNNEYKKHAKKLSPDQHQAVRDYKHHGFRDINKYHRHRLYDNEQTKNEVLDNTKHLDHVTSHKTKKDMHVYRHFGDMHIHHLKKGDTVHDHAYTSTTTNRHILSSIYSSYNPEGKVVHMAKIHVPKGTKGYYLDNDGHKHRNQDEKEFLLHRGSHMKVTGHSVDHESGVHYTHMTVHKQDEHK